jgi:hypothetical protein
VVRLKDSIEFLVEFYGIEKVTAVELFPYP